MHCREKTSFNPAEPMYHRLLIDLLARAQKYAASQVKNEDDKREQISVDLKRERDAVGDEERAVKRSCAKKTKLAEIKMELGNNQPRFIQWDGDGDDDDNSASSSQDVGTNNNTATGNIFQEQNDKRIGKIREFEDDADLFQQASDDKESEEEGSSSEDSDDKISSSLISDSDSYLGEFYSNTGTGFLEARRILEMNAMFGTDTEPTNDIPDPIRDEDDDHKCSLPPASAPSTSAPQNRPMCTK